MAKKRKSKKLSEWKKRELERQKEEQETEQIEPNDRASEDWIEEDEIVSKQTSIIKDQSRFERLLQDEGIDISDKESIGDALGSLLTKMVRPLSEAPKPTEVRSVKPKKPETLQDQLERLAYSSDIVSVRYKTIKKRKKKIIEDQSEIYDITDIVDLNDFSSEFVKHYDEAAAMFSSMISKTLAYSNALSTVIEALQESTEFKDVEVDSKFLQRALTYLNAQQLSNHLGLDAKALEYVLNEKDARKDNANGELFNLLKVLKLQAGR